MAKSAFAKQYDFPISQRAQQPSTAYKVGKALQGAGSMFEGLGRTAMTYQGLKDAMAGREADKLRASHYANMLMPFAETGADQGPVGKAIESPAISKAPTGKEDFIKGGFDTGAGPQSAIGGETAPKKTMFGEAIQQKSAFDEEAAILSADPGDSRVAQLLQQRMMDDISKKVPQETLQEMMASMENMGKAYADAGQGHKMAEVYRDTFNFLKRSHDVESAAGDKYLDYLVKKELKEMDVEGRVDVARTLAGSKPSPISKKNQEAHKSLLNKQKTALKAYENAKKAYRRDVAAYDPDDPKDQLAIKRLQKDLLSSKAAYDLVSDQVNRSEKRQGGVGGQLSDDEIIKLGKTRVFQLISSGQLEITPKQSAILDALDE